MAVLSAGHACIASTTSLQSEFALQAVMAFAHVVASHWPQSLSPKVGGAGGGAAAVSLESDVDAALDAVSALADDESLGVAEESAVSGLAAGGVAPPHPIQDPRATTGTATSATQIRADFMDAQYGNRRWMSSHARMLNGLGKLPVPVVAVANPPRI